MKILKNNYEKKTIIEEKDKTTLSYPRQHTCEMCSSELEYEKSDMRMGAWGCMWIDCPLCGYENMLDDNEYCITLTADNIEFPVHFHHTSIENGAVDCFNNEEIKKVIHKAIDYFREHKEVYHWYTCYGNLYISVDRYDGDECYEVYATNNYYSMSIPFEETDY